MEEWEWEEGGESNYDGFQRAMLQVFEIVRDRVAGGGGGGKRGGRARGGSPQDKIGDSGVMGVLGVLGGVVCVVRVC